MISAPKLTILGGSTPFTAALFDAIACSDYRLQPHELMLFGRNHAALDVMTLRARHCLGPFGWRARSTTSRAEALEGATFVIHQIRYGDLDGREAGERLARRFGIPADETLGPAALQWAIRHASAVKETANCIASCCSSAWILNLTNPLSVTTAILIREGVTRCVGVCELPEATADAVAHIVGVDRAELQWEYVGLNHRGFLYDFSVDGRPLHSTLMDALPSEDLPGVTRDDLEAFHAVPLKYFSLVRAPKPTAPRAAVLRELRAALLCELAADPTISPPSLGKRNLDWYAKGVVPLLAALAAADGRIRVVNVMGPDNVVIETKAEVHPDVVVPIKASRPSPAVESWMGLFCAHEHSLLEAATTTSPDTIRKALRLDPLVPPGHVEALTRELLRGR
jgi:6-phospho-beta-glucosidase